MIYVLANIAYFVVLTQDEILASNAVAVVSLSLFWIGLFCIFRTERFLDIGKIFFLSIIDGKNAPYIYYHGNEKDPLILLIPIKYFLLQTLLRYAPSSIAFDVIRDTFGPAFARIFLSYDFGSTRFKKKKKTCNFLFGNYVE